MIKNKMKPTILTILTFLLPFSVLFAQETDTHGIEKRMKECLDDTSNVSQMDMRRCVFEAIGEYQELIDTLTTKLEQNLSAEGRQKLKTSTVAWENYFEKEKEFIYNLPEERNGTMYSTIAAGAVLELVKQRAEFLEGSLNLYKETMDGKIEK